MGSDIAIVYRAPIDARHKTRLQICGLLVPWSWLFCRSQLFFESTYAQVHENRVEWSNPGMSVQFNPEGGGAADLQCCAACGGKDRVQVIYLDTRRATFAESPTICLPLFTHCDLCPTCCDLCGDGVVMYGNKMILCWVIGFLTCNPTCCRVWSIIYGLTDGPGFIDVVHQQKEAKQAVSCPGCQGDAEAAISCGELTLLIVTVWKKSCVRLAVVVCDCGRYRSIVFVGN